MTDYHKEKLRQLDLWVAGISVHDSIYNECCPDLSCCFPGLGPMKNYVAIDRGAFRIQYMQVQKLEPLPIERITE
jgi:hypothetical protein